MEGASNSDIYKRMFRLSNKTPVLETEPNAQSQKGTIRFGELSSLNFLLALSIFGKPSLVQAD